MIERSSRGIISLWGGTEWDEHARDVMKDPGKVFGSCERGSCSVNCGITKQCANDLRRGRCFLCIVYRCWIVILVVHFDFNAVRSRDATEKVPAVFWDPFLREGAESTDGRKKSCFFRNNGGRIPCAYLGDA